MNARTTFTGDLTVLAERALKLMADGRERIVDDVCRDLKTTQRRASMAMGELLRAGAVTTEKACDVAAYRAVPGFERAQAPTPVNLPVKKPEPVNYFATLDQDGLREAMMADIPKVDACPHFDPVKTVRAPSGNRKNVIDALKSLGNATTAQIAERAGVPASSVKDHIRRMRNSGQVKRVGRVPTTRGGNYAIYALKEGA